MRSKDKGFFIVELALNTLLTMIILAIFLKCIHLTVLLNEKSNAQINIRENQRIIFQTLRQQLAFYTKKVTILPGAYGDVLVITDVTENRKVSYYVSKEQGRGILYQAIQVQQGQAGVNQLTDPYNVEVLEFKAEKIAVDKLLVSIKVQDRRNSKLETRQEYLQLLNGQVL